MAVSDDETEKEYLRLRIEPKMIVGGFTTVNICIRICCKYSGEILLNSLSVLMNGKLII